MDKAGEVEKKEVVVGSDQRGGGPAPEWRWGAPASEAGGREEEEEKRIGGGGREDDHPPVIRDQSMLNRGRAEP